jgi:hypothetical protein
VHGQGQDTDELGRFEHPDAEPAAGMHDHLSGTEGADLGQAAHEAGKGVLGYREQDEVHADDDLGYLAARHPRQQLGGAGLRLLADRGDRGHGVTGPVEGGTEDGTDPTGAHDAHGEPRRTVLAGRVVGCTHDARTYPGRMDR